MKSQLLEEENQELKKKRYEFEMEKHGKWKLIKSSFG